MSRHAERLRQVCREHRGTIAHGHDPVRRVVPAGRHDSRDRARLFMKPDRDRGIPPRIVEAIAAIAHKHQLHTQLRCRLAKRSDLIPEGRCYEQNAFVVGRFHLRPPTTRHPRTAPRTVVPRIVAPSHRYSASIGSAQQYHGSLTYGTGVPDVIMRAEAGWPACSCATSEIAPNTAVRADAVDAMTSLITSA